MKVHYITEAGREELRRWLTTRLLSGEVREPWLIQIFSAGQLSDEEVLDIFEHQAEQLRARWVESVIQRLRNKEHPSVEE